MHRAQPHIIRYFQKEHGLKSNIRSIWKRLQPVRKRNGNLFPDHDTLYHEVRETLVIPHCPICTLLQASTDERLGYLFHENVNDPGVREELRSSMGYCSRHAADAVRCGNALGLTIISRDLLMQFLHHTKRDGYGAPTEQRTECPLCVMEREDTHLYLYALGDALRESDIRTLYRNGFGLCLPHLEGIYGYCNEETAKWLAMCEERKMRLLMDELGEFIRKSDYRFLGEPIGTEGNAWSRAMEKISGGNIQRISDSFLMRHTEDV